MGFFPLLLHQISSLEFFSFFVKFPYKALNSNLEKYLCEFTVPLLTTVQAKYRLNKVILTLVTKNKTFSFAFLTKLTPLSLNNLDNFPVP